MSFETLLSLGAMIVAVIGAVASSRKSSAEIAETQVKTEKLLRDMLNAETEKRKELEAEIDALKAQREEDQKRLTEFEAYMEELRFGVNALTKQIVEEYKGIPVWTLRRRKDDK